MSRRIWRFPKGVTSLSHAPRSTGVAGFGMLLCVPPTWTRLDYVIGSAEAGKGRDAQGYRGEFIRLVKTARDLALPD